MHGDLPERCFPFSESRRRASSGATTITLAVAVRVGQSCMRWPEWCVLWLTSMEADSQMLRTKDLVYTDSSLLAAPGGTSVLEASALMDKARDSPRLLNFELGSI